MRHEIYETDKHSSHQLEFRSESSHPFDISLFQFFDSFYYNFKKFNACGLWILSFMISRDSFFSETSDNWKLPILIFEWVIENLYILLFVVQLFIQLRSPFFSCFDFLFCFSSYFIVYLMASLATYLNEFQDAFTFWIHRMILPRNIGQCRFLCYLCWKKKFFVCHRM